MAILKRCVHLLALISYILIGVYVLLCVPMIFKYKPLVVLSGSMEPTFKVGGLVYYKEIKEDDLKVGDVITFKSPRGELISHRIYSIDNGLYETKGDMNDSPDSLKIKYDAILGKDANICIPYVGYYVRFINNNFYVVIVLIIILVSEFLLSNMRTLDINKNIEGRKGNGKEENE